MTDGIEVFYQDGALAVCRKPPGVLSQCDGQEDMVCLLRRQLGGEILPVHRLDREVGGVMVFARNRRAAAALSEQMQQGTFVKRYLAVVQGVPEPPEGEMRDLLFRDARRNKSFVVTHPRKGTREARLAYRVVARGKGENGGYAVAEVRLYTGRTHQIRVQFASRRHPLLGDGRYGSRDRRCPLALWSYRVTFVHPETGAPLDFSVLPDRSVLPWNALSGA